jgi:gluconate kinase
MPAALLDSQLATLEPLEHDEPGIVVDATAPPDAVVADVLARLRAR